MTKKTVFYDPTYPVAIIPGLGAFVKPIDHPDAEHVSNTKMVYTSNVVEDRGEGSFETQNTVYVANTLCLCRHPRNVHTIDAPMDYMGCTECTCNEFTPNE